MSDDPKNGSPLRKEAVGSMRDDLLLEVGYKRPPKHTQFQPGHSGNPKGRPRVAPPDLSLAEQPALETILRVSRKLVKIREGDRILEVPMYDALAQSIYASALKGNARAQGLAMDLTRGAEQKHAREVQERNRLWSDYKETMSARLAQAAAKGEPAEPVHPHPDDIVIDPVHGPRFLGPLDAFDEVKVKQTIAFCETLILQNVLDERSTVRLNGKPLTEPGSAMLLFHLLQRTTPPRLRFTEDQITLRWMKYEAWPKRRLLKALHQAWHQLGEPMQRGTVMPNLSSTRKRLAFLFELFADFTAGRIDVDGMARGEPDDATLDLLEKHGIQFG